MPKPSPRKRDAAERIYSALFDGRERMRTTYPWPAYPNWSKPEILRAIRAALREPKAIKRKAKVRK